jgi:hypothetical protein
MRDDTHEYIPLQQLCAVRDLLTRYPTLKSRAEIEGVREQNAGEYIWTSER